MATCPICGCTKVSLGETSLEVATQRVGGRLPWEPPPEEIQQLRERVETAFQDPSTPIFLDRAQQEDIVHGQVLDNNLNVGIATTTALPITFTSTPNSQPIWLANQQQPEASIVLGIDSTNEKNYISTNKSIYQNEEGKVISLVVCAECGIMYNAFASEIELNKIKEKIANIRQKKEVSKKNKYRFIQR